jgi:NAD(P)-dependent dehydrogenase (short-subunit alcohol dehydrogenase family)
MVTAKLAHHPHTNMAKVALNMMTQTSSEDLAKNRRVFMNLVDTGWINDENPFEMVNETPNVNNFKRPLMRLMPPRVSWIPCFREQMVELT